MLQAVLAECHNASVHRLNQCHVPWFISMLSGRGRGGHHGFPGGGGGGDGGGGGE